MKVTVGKRTWRQCVKEGMRWRNKSEGRVYNYWVPFSTSCQDTGGKIKVNFRGSATSMIQYDISRTLVGWWVDHQESIFKVHLWQGQKFGGGSWKLENLYNKGNYTKMPMMLRVMLVSYASLQGPGVTLPFQMLELEGACSFHPRPLPSPSFSFSSFCLSFCCHPWGTVKGSNHQPFTVTAYISLGFQYTRMQKGVEVLW